MSTTTMYEPAHTAHSVAADNRSEGTGTGTRKKVIKRRKVSRACLYCRRSHMTCDEVRPCQRCIKREIGHLCRDEQQKPRTRERATPETQVAPAPVQTQSHRVPVQAPSPRSNMNSPWFTTQLSPLTSADWLFQPQHETNNEFSVLSDFLKSLDNGFNEPPDADTFASGLFSTPGTQLPQDNSNAESSNNTSPKIPIGVLPSATKTERFLLTAAHQESGSRTERLDRVIRSKYEAGLLRPYDYVSGYKRLGRWMDTNVSQESKAQILRPLSVLRPKFRAIAQSLQDLDLVFIEEAFERLLLDYDRVFAAMGVPACLWRRTGEIYKANREFEKLVGLEGGTGPTMRDGRLCIYQLMAEESAVNYWEKYGNIAFDASQKAVLTSCVLRYKPRLNLEDTGDLDQEGFVNCCFSFTIRRDRWGIPTMIVGNFMRV